MPFNNKRNSRDDKSGNARPSSYPKRSDGNRNFDDRKRNFGDNRTNSDYRPGRDRDERPSRGSTYNSDKRSDGDRNFDDRKRNFGDNRTNSEHRPGRDRDERPSRSSTYNSDKRSDRPDRPYQDDRRSSYGDRKKFSDGGPRKPFEDSPRKYGPSDDRRKPFGDRDRNSRSDRPYKNERPYSRRDDSRPSSYRERPENRFDDDRKFRPRKDNGESKRYEAEPSDDGLIRLNRYIANAGICSRRKADELITAGVVAVNGEVVTELGTKVDPAKDEIRYNGERLKREKMVYVLLNKPKDYITTTEDPQERRTVMQLVDKASKERIYPVGRLDRNTTGLLLMTNDGNLAEKLSHPRNNITKIYQVELSKNLAQGDFNKLAFGLELEDGFIKPDDISYVQGASKKEIGIQIHSGKNRIVRRMFESLGYEVIKLDRVIYGPLTKKDLTRGRWRYLEEREIIQLKHFVK